MLQAAEGKTVMLRLEGKSILVVGAGGIGSELARRYAAEGASVVLGDLDLDGAKAVAAEIESAGGRAVGVQLDGADEASVNAAVAFAVKSFGGIDGLHANFASFVDGPADIGIAELPLEVFDETMRVNLRGFVLLPALLERGGGSIIFTSSIAAIVGAATQPAYAMSKAAGHALMRHIANRYGPQGIRANCIAPGTILHGDMAETLPEEFKQHLLAIAKIKSRFGRPADIAALGTLLMSDDGSYITGQVMTVDGGATMRS
jgi:NAD(P)-dependent dehydrogenase (short-subunit alcohol dehydrogenase family)